MTRAGNDRACSLLTCWHALLKIANSESLKKSNKNTIFSKKNVFFKFEFIYKIMWLQPQNDGFINAKLFAKILTADNCIELLKQISAVRRILEMCFLVEALYFNTFLNTKLEGKVKY